jgi:hypothetical protein
VRFADFLTAFLTDLRAVDFLAEERFADFAAAFFTALFGALRAVFFAATYLLLFNCC